MKSTLFAALAAFHSLSIAAPTNNFRYVRHERREESSIWIKRDTVSSSFMLPMRIGLVQGSLDKGHDMLMDVYVAFSHARRVVYFCD
jgi:hypothetical protein